jgi:hypothetical protein
MPYSIDAPLANLIRSDRNNGVRSALSTVETPPTATAGDQDAPSVITHLILADFMPRRAMPSPPVLGVFALGRG